MSRNEVSSATSERRTPPPGKSWLKVALATLLVAWGGNQFTAMLVFYRADGHFGNFFIDLTLAIYAVGVACGLLAAGTITDFVGRRPVMLVMPAVSMVASLLIALGAHNAFLIGTGRLLAGIAVGGAMTAGGSWIKELSRPGQGARRAAMSLTLGLGLGPLTAGLLAQWLPWPSVLVYVLHLVMMAAAYPLLRTVPETFHRKRISKKAERPKAEQQPRPPRQGTLRATILNPRFLLVVLPIAPWVFGAAFTAQAILPGQLYQDLTYPVAFSGLNSLITMGVGFGIQQIAPRFDDCRARGPVTAMLFAVVGMTAATFAAMHPSALGTLGSAVLLGLAYGMSMYIGLAETQRIAPARDLGVVTGIFYCGAYVGMLFPAALTKLAAWFSYPMMLGFGIFMAVVCLVLTWTVARRR